MNDLRLLATSKRNTLLEPNLKFLILYKDKKGKGTALHRGSIHPSHPEVPGLLPGSAQIFLALLRFFLYCLVWRNQTHPSANARDFANAVGGEGLSKVQQNIFVKIRKNKALVRKCK